MLIKGRFLQSRVARRFFLSAFLLAAVVLLSVGTLFYQLGDQLARRAALAVLTESTRGVSRNLFDSLTAANRLLRAVGPAQLAQASGATLPLRESQQEVFSAIMVMPPASPGETRSGVPRLEVAPSPPDGPPQLAIVLPPEGDRPGLRGVLRSESFWERAESGLYNLCVRVDRVSRPYCQKNHEDAPDAVSVQRDLLFRPFFDADPWKMKATASAELTQLLPVSLTLAVVGISALAFLAALIASSIYLRRWAGSLDRLVGATRKAGSGDLTERVPVETLRDELRDLGTSFNAMMGSLQSHEAALSAQAHTDSLTGLLNRHGFLDKLQAMIAQPRWGGSFDVVFLDLDGFKEINDAFGHFVGDEILRQFGKRLRQRLDHVPHHLARLGGDEFAVLLPVDAVAPLCSAFRTALREPFRIEGREIMLAFSMGSASFPANGVTVADLLRQSDLAMYKAKAQGGGALVRFSADLDAAATERMSLLHQLRQAQQAQTLHVVYQPRVSATSGLLVSAEALMRWKHPDLGWVSPARFIPLAEESGLIVPFGYWILEETCRQFKAWQAAGIGLRQVSVNVSPIQMMAPGFFERAAAILRQYDIAAGSVELEITEGAMVQNIEATAARIRELQVAGFHVALDDFGVGYSALSYLHRIPFDTLKVDQSFVRQLHESQVSYAIATAIVTLAKALGKRVVAEGVERAEHAEALTALGADELQGYYFGRPMEASAVAEMARAALRVSDTSA